MSRMTEWTIHQAQPCDVDAIHRIANENQAAILSRVHGEAAMRLAYEESTKDALLRQLGWKHVLVAKVANEVVGTAALANFGRDGVDRWCVSNVYVDMRLHRKGIGKGLVEAVIGLARARGAAKIEVPSSRNAIAFYSRFGFVVSGPEASDEVSWLAMELASDG